MNIWLKWKLVNLLVSLEIIKKKKKIIFVHARLNYIQQLRIIS